MRLRDFKNFITIERKEFGTLHGKGKPQTHFQYNIKFKCFVKLYDSDKYIKIIREIETFNSHSRISIIKIMARTVYSDLNLSIINFDENSKHTYSIENIRRSDLNKIISKKQIQEIFKLIAHEHLAR